MKKCVPHIPTQSTIERQLVRDEIMHQHRSSEKCYDVIRMGPQAFKVLSDILQRDGDLQDTMCHSWRASCQVSSHSFHIM